MESRLSDDDEVLHSRTLLLPDITEAQLHRLRESRVLMVGAGGLGCPAAQALACAGLGHLLWFDPDRVALTNLPRQVLFGPQDVGRAKVLVGAARLAELAPGCRVEAEQRPVDADNVDALVANADLVMDCTDQFATRQLINASCVRQGVPLVSASVIQWSGQCLVIHPSAAPEEGCYACLFDPSLEGVDAACGAFGVFPTAAMTMGVLQAHLALLELLASPATSSPRPLRLIDFKHLDIQMVARHRRVDCPVCGESAQA